MVAPGVDQPEILAEARSGYFEAHESVEWQKGYADQMSSAKRVTSLTQD
jgi:hypothetical protein